MQVSDFVIPLTVAGIIFYGLYRGLPIFDTFMKGAKNGLSSIVTILPSLIGLVTAVSMFRASGAIDALSKVLAPACNLLKIPTEIVPLALIRPISGGGSIGLLTDTIKTFGVTSRITLCACILCASTETTFYTLSVYFGPTRVKYTKRVIFAAVFGDLMGILCASLLSTINF